MKRYRLEGSSREERIPSVLNSLGNHPQIVASLWINSVLPRPICYSRKYVRHDLPFPLLKFFEGM